MRRDTLTALILSIWLALALVAYPGAGRHDTATQTRSVHYCFSHVSQWHYPCRHPANFYDWVLSGEDV